MHIREATITDIPDLFAVRMSVKENILNTPALVTDEICANYLTQRGKGWVCVVDNTIVGFAIADLEDNSVWALFVRPEYEGKGIGKRLYDIMIDWYFSQTQKTAWLSTDPNTRAEKFYTKAGWKIVGTIKSGEVKMELSKNNWENKHLK